MNQPIRLVKLHSPYILSLFSTSFLWRYGSSCNCHTLYIHMFVFNVGNWKFLPLVRNFLTESSFLMCSFKYAAATHTHTNLFLFQIFIYLYSIQIIQLLEVIVILYKQPKFWWIHEDQMWAILETKIIKRLITCINCSSSMLDCWFTQITKQAVKSAYKQNHKRYCSTKPPYLFNHNLFIRNSLDSTNIHVYEEKDTFIKKENICTQIWIVLNGVYRLF